MKEFEFSHEAVTKLDEQAEQATAANPDERTDDDPVQQTLDVPTERSEDDAVKFVQKQYKDKSGLELDEESAREIVNTARSGGAADSKDDSDDSDADGSADSARESSG
jgi:hypothetical protein